MKIIQAMKELKNLKSKLDDLKAKVQNHSADLSIETPPYEDMQLQVKSWLDGYHDTLKRMAHLRVSIQRTNLATQVAIQLEGQTVVKTIA